MDVSEVLEILDTSIDAAIGRVGCPDPTRCDLLPDKIILGYGDDLFEVTVTRMPPPAPAAVKPQCHWASDADESVTKFLAQDTFTKNEDGYYHNADGVYVMDWARGVFEANPPPAGWHNMLVAEDSPHYVKAPQT